MGMFNPERNIDGIIDNGDIDGVGRSNNVPRLDWLRASIDKVCDLLDRGVDVNARDKNGVTLWTRLFYEVAAEEDASWEYMMETLVEAGKANVKDGQGQIPLHEAVTILDRSEALEYLVKHTTDINAKDNNGQTPLHFAIQGAQDISVSACLVEHGADINAKDKDGNTPLHMAVSGFGALYNDVLKYLIEHGADINAKDKKGNTPLHVGIAWNNKEVVEFFVEHGADVNAKNNDGCTPLHWACQEGNTDVVKYLVEHGADTNAKDKDGNTPFKLATKEHHTEIVQYMIHHLGEKILADVHTKDKEGLASTIQSTPAEKMQGDLSALKDVAKDEQTPEQVARTNEQIGNLSEAVLNNVNSMDAGVKEQDKAVLTQLAGKGYDKATEELAKLEEQSKTSSLKTILTGAEEKDEPVSEPTAAKGMSYALSDEYTRGNDVSISITNTALTKNKGR